jgi:signal transduction histidine kinase
MQVFGRLKWRDGRTVAALFAVTIVLPALTLALLAFRTLDSDRRLAEQAWRDRLQGAARLSYARFEERIQDVQFRTDALSRGQPQSGSAADGIALAVLSPSIQPQPATAFAWVPDGRAGSAAPLPAELEKAEVQEQRAGDPKTIEAAYSSLFERTPPLWHGWLYLRLARTYARLGDPDRRAKALRQAARLPDSPGSPPTSLAAGFELSANSPGEAVRLYAELTRGRWLLEKSLYAFYEEDLRRRVGPGLPPESIAAERRRQSLSRFLEKAADGATGWLQENGASALVLASTGPRKAAAVVPESAIRAWMPAISSAGPRDLKINLGTHPPDNGRLAAALSLSPLGLPFTVWSEPADPRAPERENANRQRLLLSILIMVGGILLFGTLVTIRMVRRELRVAQMQSEFAATVSHEFRSPLTGIRQLAEMLLAGRGAADEAKRRQYYELICRESERLTRLVENVLDFSRIENGRKEYRFEPIQPGEWLAGLVAVASQRRPVDVSMDEDLPPVAGDREALSSAVLNLLDNAIKYSPDSSAVRLRARRAGEWVNIEVEDEGAGIEPDEQQRIFDRFYRGSNTHGGPARGVGLGLALVKSIADAHGARLGLRSRPGQGSTFTLSLRAVE